MILGTTLVAVLVVVLVKLLGRSWDKPAVPEAPPGVRVLAASMRATERRWVP